MSVFDFQAQQESSRRATMVLVLFFVLMVAIIGLAIGLLAAALLGTQQPTGQQAPTLDPMAILGFAVMAMAVIFAVALIRIVMLGGDGARVARSLGAEEVSEDTRNAFLKRYLNIVDEMAIAAGLPRPRVFIIKHESGINAFAAGADPERAAVAVTHGALAKLNREELAGVVAHEMAHIANRDTRLNTRLMGMVFGLVAVYTAGRFFLRSALFTPRRRNSRGALPNVAIGVGLVVLGLLGVLGGRILQSAVSRRREYLADATGVQFTRNPQGLANALKKIGATSQGSRVANAHAEEARHMYFSSATGTLGGLFATHPPLVERIKALEPDFDPQADPLMKLSETQIIRETRRDLAAGPWERAS